MIRPGLENPCLTTLSTLNLLTLLNYTSLIYLYDNDEFINRNVLFSKECNYIIRNLNLDYEVFVSSRQDLVLINVEILDKLQDYLKENYRTIYWNREAVYVLVNANPKSLEEIFKILWNFYCVKSLILTKNLDLYSFSPIRENSIEPKFLGTAKSFEFPNFDDDLLYFNDFEIRVGSVKLAPYVINETDPVNPGYEVTMMREIGRKLQIVYKYFAHNETNHGDFVDGKLTGLYGFLEKRKIDLVVGAAKAEGYLVDFFDGSNCYATMPMGIFTPPAKLMRVSKKILYIFSLTIWVLITLVIISVLLPLAIYNKQFNTQTKLLDDFLLLIQLCFTTHQIKGKHIFLKMILIIWSMGCFLLTTIFNNTFMSFAAIPSYEAQISTLEELNQADLKLGGYIVSRKFVSGQNATFQKLYDNWINCTLQGDECIDSVISGKQALVKNLRSLRYRLGIFGYAKVHLTAILNINYLWLVLEKGLPVYKRFNEMILRMQASGLINLWENQAMRVHAGEATQYKIKLNLEFAFAILLSGNFVATLVFLSEILKRKTKN